MEISGAAYNLLATPRSDKGDRQQRAKADGKGTPKRDTFYRLYGKRES